MIYKKVFSDAWSELPREPALVWLAVTYTSVILYETMKIWLASGTSAKNAFFGASGDAGENLAAE